MAATFSPSALQALAALHPTRAGVLSHGLSGHPLFALEALAKLAEALPAGSAEHNAGDLPVAVAPADVVPLAQTPAATIRAIGQAGAWVALKRIEQVPAYAELLAAVLGEVAGVVVPRTGRMLGLEGFVFVSSPNAMTPLHFDPEHNLLLQLAGTKTMTVFSAGDAALCPDETHELFHLGEHHRNLPWSEAFEGSGRELTIAPGEAIHVPVKAPHFVRNGPDPSISLSLTWRSEWSYAEADARALNRWLRARGLRPRAPAPYPARNRAKALAWRALRKAGA